MATTADHPTIAAAPDDIAGYRVVRALAAGPGAPPSYLALSAADRYVVLKPLDDDCLHRGQLHPAVLQRLARVRELAHPGIANLHSVERDAGGGGGGAAYLVWEHAEGRTFDEFLAAGPTPKELWLAGRELILTVEALHAQGIVHGAVHGRNVIVAPTGRVRLTHVSPLLYTDPGEDEQAVLDLLAAAAAAPDDAALSEAVTAARAEPKHPLRRLSGRLAELLEAREAPRVVPAPGDADDRRPRAGAVAGAVVTACVGLAIVYGAIRYAGATTMPAPMTGVRAE
ncbi:MAG TPA: hypothetical protein VK324_15305 [Tepidisphaeraceae bacterium]|nr:hypothetical protein [Tepidisphaeraceae bacterium]